MKVLLINPPSLRLAGFQWPCFHLGLGYIAAMLVAEGHETKIYNADIDKTQSLASHHYPSYKKANTLSMKYSAGLQNPDHEAWREVDKVIREYNPEVIGITCMVFNMLSALMVARIAKSINKKIRVVLGGPAATTCTDLILADENVDIAVRGEGEATMVELLKEFQRFSQDFQSVEGISYRNSNSVIHNKRRALIENIDCLPYPSRNLLLYADTLPEGIIKSMMGDIITSRGCPYGCSYCANHTIWGSRKGRMRRAQNVVNEILYLKETFGVRHFVFWDDLFTVSRQRVSAICTLLLKRKANISWTCLIRADTMDLQLLKLMKKAGCCEVQMGVESGSNRILKKVKKGVGIEQIKQAAKLIRDSGLRWHAFLMIGIPGETIKEMEATINLIPQLKPDKVQLSVFTPYPGTPLYHELEAKGQLNNKNWLDADFLNPQHSYVGTVPREEFQNLALQYMETCDEYNATIGQPTSPFAFYVKHPFLLTQKLIEKFMNRL